jgi:hypothetical protein
MHTISFDKEALRVTISNQYPDLELTSPVYYSTGTTCYISPNQQTVFGTRAKASLGIGSQKGSFKGALLYKLQRKHTTKAGNQLNNNIVSIKNTATDMYLLVAWNVEYYIHQFYVCLIECPDNFILDEDKLWALCNQYNDQFYKDYYYKSITWLMHEGEVMKIRHKMTYGPNYKLDIFISEEAGYYNTKGPAKIDPKRLVLSLYMSIMLTYTVSLRIPLSFKLNIHNQCLHVDLASPIYVISDGLECHRPPDHKVHAGSTTKSAFMIESDNASCGALIYKVEQIHESAEIGKDASNAAYLLTAWSISESKELHANVLLIKHDEAFTWNKDKLGSFCYENCERLKEYTDTISDTWCMNNNTTLKTTFSVGDLRGNSELSISISEERDDYAIRPLCVDLER